MSDVNKAKIGAVLAALLAGSAAAVQAAEPVRVPVSAAPAAVTVYNDQASVTRTGTADIPAGNSILVISGIPAGIVRDSVNAKGRAVERVAIGSVEVRQVSFDPAEGNRRRSDLSAQSKAIDIEIAKVDIRIASLNARHAQVTKMAAAAAAGSETLVQNPAAWGAASDIVAAESKETGDALRLADIEKAAWAEKKQVLAAQMSQIGGNGQGLLEFAVSVSAEKATRIELSVTYQVRGATWKPLYEARLDSASGQVVLRQEAAVTQRTGEDWDNVALSLSSSHPSAGVQAPEMSPWRIALVDPAALRGSNALQYNDQLRAREAKGSGAIPAPILELRPGSAASPSVMVGNAAGDGAAIPPPPPPPMVEVGVVNAVLNPGGISVDYGIPGATSIHSDGTSRTVRIGDLSAASKLVVMAVPKLDVHAYLFASFLSPSDAPLLSGSSSLYLDGVFVGHAQLPLMRPGEDIKIPFGADDRVKITYEPQDVKASSDWGLTAGTRDNHAYTGLTVVHSYHDKPVTVTVTDQMPTSSDENLKVQEKSDPVPTQRNVDNRPGVVSWTYDLNKGDERKITFGYTVSAPEGRVITGLQR